MRRILVASLLSSFALAAAAATPQPADNPSTPLASTAVRVSTGITVPQLSSTATVHIPDDEALGRLPNPASMLVRITLDSTGSATSLQVLRSISPRVDAHVIEAIRQFHWRPATLDNQPIPFALNLTVEVQH